MFEDDFLARPKGLVKKSNSLADPRQLLANIQGWQNYDRVFLELIKGVVTNSAEERSPEPNLIGIKRHRRGILAVNYMNPYQKDALLYFDPALWRTKTMVGSLWSEHVYFIYELPAMDMAEEIVKQNLIPQIEGLETVSVEIDYIEIQRAA